MFPENLQTSEKIVILLSNINQTLKNDRSVHQLKKIIDKIDSTIENYDKSERNQIALIQMVLTDMLFTESVIVASKQFLDYETKLLVLEPVLEIVSEIISKNNILKIKYGFIYLNIYNRVVGLKYYISKQTKAAKT